MNTWLKVASCAVVGLLIFGAGYKYAASIYKVEIAQLREEYALATKELTDEYREKERGQAQQLADAWDQLERARAESVDLRDDVERVRKLADSYRSRLSAVGADSCDSLKERLAGCTKLLEEGAELSAEGARLSGEVVAKKDAITRIHGSTSGNLRLQAGEE